MRRSRPFILLGLAALMALLTSALVYNRLAQQPRVVQVVEQVKEWNTATVAVAARDLSWGTKLTEEMINLVPFPSGSVPVDHFSNREGLVGRVSLANIRANEPILESKLAPISVTTGGLAAVTSPDKRAMAVKVDDVVGVAGFINPGNRVDVMVTLAQSPPITKTVLQNMLVLSTGVEVERRGKEEKPSSVKVITLEVTPEEGEKLALAANEGKLQLALRNVLNAEAVLTRGATVPALLKSYTPVEVAKPVAKSSKPRAEVTPYQVEVIKGGSVSTLTFKDKD